jgi:hypothetical protein
LKSATEGAEGAADIEILAAAAARVAFAEADVWARIEEAPGFAVFLEHGARGAAGGGIEADAFALSDGLDGDDVPEVFGDDVDDQEIDFFAGIDTAVGTGGFDAIAIFGITGGGFDLDADESAVEFDDGIVAVAVSPGEEDGEEEGGSTGEESGFGSFSAAFASADGDSLDGDVEKGPWAWVARDVKQDRVSHNEKDAAGGCVG